MWSIKRWYRSVLSLDGTLSKRKQQVRALFFGFNVATLLGALVYIPSSTEKFDLEPIFAVALIIVSFVSLFAVLAVLSKMNLTAGLMTSCAYGNGFAMCLGDLTYRVKGDTMWAPLVLIVDLLLVMEVPTRYTVVFVAGVTVWLCTASFEEMFRFGLFDLPGLLPQHGVHGRWELHRKQGECTELPCARDNGLLVSAVAVFLIDFIATRGFARDMLKEQATMQRTINVVQEIASLLARYDVEEVAELLATHEHELPEGMAAALRRLEQNLRVYKAYLPQTCLPFEEDLHEGDSASFTYSSETSSQASSRRMSVVKPETVVRVLGLAQAKATLFSVNIKDTLRLLEDDSARFSELFTAMLLGVLRATEAKQGMVDVFVGDKVHCSFNVSRKCITHATSALHAATMLFRTSSNDLSAHFNIGIATGKLLRGDMGCEVMRRFSMVGALVRDVHLIERAGRVFGCDVLCNRICFSDAECEHQVRLIPCKVEVSQGCETEVVAELVVSDDKLAVGANEDNEWMYVIGDNRRWDAYNTAVRMYLLGSATADDVSAQAKEGDRISTPVTVVAGAIRVLNLPVYDSLAKQCTQ